MSWVKLDDQFPYHPKIVGLSSDAFRVHVSAMCYCSAYLTDGRITPLVTRYVTALVTNPDAVTNELVAAGLWDADADGYIIHDYLEYNPSAVEVKQQRKANADRQARHRDAKHNAVSNKPHNTVTNASVTAPPSPSPSPIQRDEGIARPPAVVASAFPENDPDWGAAISKLECARIGGMTGQVLLELSALWPDLDNGHREWLDDAIRVAQANKAKSPVYALRVLAGAIQSGERPGQAPARGNRRGGVSDAEIDAIAAEVLARGNR